MLDNKTIQLKGREWEYSAAQANGNNNGISKGERGTNYATASGLRSIFKQIAAAGKAEKSISISYSEEKKKSFPLCERRTKGTKCSLK